MSKKVLDVPKAAVYLGDVSERTIRRKASELGGFYLGQRLLFTEEALDSFIESHQLAARPGRKGARLKRVS